MPKNIGFDMLEYRELVAQEANNVQELRMRVIAADPYSFSISIDEERQGDPTFFESYIKNSSDSENALILGAWNERLVGVIGIDRHSGELVRHKARIWGPYVCPKNRGNGVGTELLNRVFEFAKKMEQLEILTLEASSASDNAISLFRKFGFVETGRDPNALKFNSVYCDLLRLQTTV